MGLSEAIEQNNGDIPEPSIIPVLDFSQFRHGSKEDSLQTAQKLYEAFRDVGFVYLKNYGLPQEIVDEAFAWNAKFFALPQEVKESVPHPAAGWHHRGYSGLGREKASQMVFEEAELEKIRECPDVKESFEMGRESDTRLTNIWLPEEVLPGFRKFFNEFYWKCQNVELEILRALSLGMGLDENFFDAYHTDADNQTRLLHYPPVEEHILREGVKTRIGAHSDFGTITLLFQDSVGGLEVADPNDPHKFNPAPCIPGTIIVNIGDFLMRWSNDILKSTLHRVRAPPMTEEHRGQKMTPARYSIPYFCAADKDKTIECLPGCFGPERPKRYEPTTSGEYVTMRLNALY